MARFGLKTTVAAAAVAVSAAAFCPGTAQAFVFTTGGKGTATFTVKDKRFANFTCVSANPGCGIQSYTAAPAGALGVLINPALIQFGPGTKDTLLEFSVATTNGAKRIIDLEVTSNAFQKGAALVSDALEICASAGCGHVLASTNLAGNLFHGTLKFAPKFGPQNLIFVSEDMTAAVRSSGGVATLSRVTKIVSQVPEPASLALVGAGLLGLGLVRRRKAK